MVRPDWWPAWLPDRCSKGHELAPGLVSLTWVSCDCPGAENDGHQTYRCRQCRAAFWPPEHTGPVRDQR